MGIAAIERMGNIYQVVKNKQKKPPDQNKCDQLLKYFCEGGNARETEENLRK